MNRYIDRFKEYSTKQIVNLILKGVTNSSDESLIHMTYLAELLAPVYKQQIGKMRHLFKTKAPAYCLAKKVLTEIHPNVRDHLVSSFIIKYLLLGPKVRGEYSLKHGIPSPATIVISPTMRCNLRCKGCYAGDYSKSDDLPFEYIDKVITEAKEMGTYFFTISGGEAFVREDMLDIYKKHHDAAFMIYTNGTFIDKGMAQKLVELGNVAPAISVEGFEVETDERRGKGVWEKVMKAMENLKEAGAVFGFSGTPSRYNTEVMYSDEMIQHLINKGCSFGWYFTYIPIGKNPNTDFMQTPKQRLYGWRRVHHLRNQYPIMIGDFWNDGAYVGGCIAGGRSYLHVNVYGDYEPCVFTHCATHNVRETSLKEALGSPLFNKIRACQKRSTFTDNWMRPCMIIDHPEIFREVKDFAHPYMTHSNAGTIFSEKIQSHLEKYSKEYGEISQPFWNRVYIRDGGIPRIIPKNLLEVDRMIREIKQEEGAELWGKR